MYLIVISTILLAYFLYKYVKDKVSPVHLIPGPEPYFLLGHLPYFFKAKDTINLMEGWANQYADYNMFKINLFVGTVKWYVVMTHPEHAKTVLSKPDVFVRSDFLPKFFPMVGKALLTATGDEHRWQKKFFAKAFSMSQMKYYIPVFSKHAKKLTDVFERLVCDYNDGRNIDVGRYFENMTLDAIGEISFGFDFKAQESSENKIAVIIRKMVQGVLDSKSRLLLTLFPFLWYAPFGPAQELKNCKRELNNIVEMVLAKRSSKIKENTLTETEENDLLNWMIKERESTGHFSEQLIKDSAFTFLFAGQETTAKGLPGVLLFLSKHPELQEKVREEVNAHIKDAEKTTLQDLNQLTYTEAFIKESLRLFTPVPQNGRISKMDYKFDDFVVPKGTGFILPSYVYHESNKYYEDAKSFNPERFLHEEERAKVELTFGYGPYSCIGKHFAILEMKTTVVHLLKHFRFSIDEGNDIFNRKVRLTLILTPNLMVRAQKLS